MFSKPKTLDGILSNFRQTQNDLREYAERQCNDADAKTEEVEALQAEIAEHKSEAQKAQNIFDNIMKNEFGMDEPEMRKEYRDGKDSNS